jgi:hypothetical protein
MAVNLVLEASGEGLDIGNKGIVSDEPDRLDRFAARAGVDVPSSEGRAFTDRKGRRHVGFDAIEPLVRAFAANEPLTVSMHIDQAERETAAGALEPGEGWRVGFLEEWRPAFALARQWAGFDRQFAAKDNEILRLRTIISRLVWTLRTDGLDDLARKVERQLRGR